MTTTQKTFTRPSFEEYGMTMAFAAAVRADDAFVRVGAALFDDEKKIISTGYNGYAEGMKVPDSLFFDREERRKFVRHAEMNCFLMKPDSRRPTYLFLTLSPCEACSHLIAANKVKHVYYANEYRCEAFKEIFKFYGVDFQRIEHERVAKTMSLMFSQEYLPTSRR